MSTNKQIRPDDDAVHIPITDPLAIEDLAGMFGVPPDGKTLAEYLEKIDRTPMVRRFYEDRRGHDGDENGKHTEPTED